MQAELTTLPMSNWRNGQQNHEIKEKHIGSKVDRGYIVYYTFIQIAIHDLCHEIIEQRNIKASTNQIPRPLLSTCHSNFG